VFGFASSMLSLEVVIGRMYPKLPGFVSNGMIDFKCQCQSKFFSVAKIVEPLQSLQRHSRVTVQNQEMTVEKEMF